jgi:hypothetical protein
MALGYYRRVHLSIPVFLRLAIESEIEIGRRAIYAC